MREVERALVPREPGLGLRLLTKDQTVGLDVLLIDLDRFGCGERGV
jgi:hypothetical protein